MPRKVVKLKQRIKCTQNIKFTKRNIIKYQIKIFDRQLMNTRPSRTAVMQRSLLKSILPIIGSNLDQRSPIILLGRISVVSFSHKTTKQKKPKCTVCGVVYENYLLFVLHLELTHQGEVEVEKYEFSLDMLTIYFKQPEKYKINTQQQYLQMANPKQYFLSHNFQDRAKDILAKITSKFVKKVGKQKQQYFHSFDVFREITANSQAEDSQDDVGHIERELEKIRIGDFTDVNQQDKQFFISWNKTLHEARKTHVIIGHPEIIQIMGEFAVTAKHENIKRLNLVMHGWTLWSTGLIKAEDVSKFLQIYDKA